MGWGNGLSLNPPDTNQRQNNPNNPNKYFCPTPIALLYNQKPAQNPTCTLSKEYFPTAHDPFALYGHAFVG